MTASRFAKGSALYACRCCSRNTRATGNNDNEHVRLCVQCYDLGGEENHLSDNGTFYTSAAMVLTDIEDLEKRGADTRCWADLKAKALAAVAAATPAAPMKPGTLATITATGGAVKVVYFAPASQTYGHAAFYLVQDAAAPGSLPFSVFAAELAAA
jgi:hypothetical protein